MDWMNCIGDCLWKKRFTIAEWAFLGGLAGLFLLGGGWCLLVGGGVVTVGGGPAGGAAVTLTCVGASAVTAIIMALIGFLVGAAIGAAAAIIYLILTECQPLCESTAVNQGIAEGNNWLLGAMPQGVPTTCASAQANLQDLNEHIKDVEARLAEQNQLVANRQSALNTAQNAVIAAAVAVTATSFWDPVALLAASAALAVAMGVAARARMELAAAKVGQAGLAAELATLRGTQEALQLTVNGICDSQGDNGTSEGDGSGVTTPSGDSGIPDVVPDLV